MNTEEIAFELILYGGNARAFSYEALRAAREGDFELAREKFQQAGEELKAAHEIQSTLLQGEAGGLSGPPSMLLVHAHGHLMTALAERNLIEEMVEMYRRIQNPEVMS
ncbi:MAG: PTS lactose/cellobiose transporter subunit IIA [bacterium]